MAKKKKTDELLEQDDALEPLETQEDNSQEDQNSQPSDTTHDAPQTDVAMETSQENGLPVSDASIPVPALQLRLEKAARSLATSGGQHRVHALNKLDILLGSVKLTLPDAIAATDDEALKADLAQLLGML